jgi:hypothetical protein
MNTKTKQPSHNKHWEALSARTPNALIRPESITLQNVRDRHYVANNSETENYTWLDNLTIVPDTDIVRTWFGAAELSANLPISHTFLSFELHTGDVYTLSVEARRTVGQTYSPIKGMSKQYPLWYGWGTERDMVGGRALLYKKQVEYYPLTLNQTQAANLFRTLATRTHEVAMQARWYNTFTSSCATELVQAANQTKGAVLPFHLAHYLPGLAVPYLMKMGYIKQQERSVIPTNSSRLLSTLYSNTKPQVFSKILRSMV